MVCPLGKLQVSVQLDMAVVPVLLMSTNTTAERVRELFRADEALTHRYNEELGGGRWRHFADQTLMAGGSSSLRLL